MLRISFIVLHILILVSTLGAQDINFSQFYELPLLRNPSLAGIYKGDLRATAAFRSQWANITVPYLSQAVSAEIRYSVAHNSDNYVSIGLQVTNDVAGDSKLGKIQFLPVVAFHKLLNGEKDTYLSLGFMGGPVQQRFDPSNLKFDDQFVNGAYSNLNPTRQQFASTEIMYMDGSVGLTLSSTINNDISYYIGGALFHFASPKVAFSKESDIKLNKKFVVNAGLSALTNEFDKFIIYADYFAQGGNSQAQGGFIYQHDLEQREDNESLSFSMGSFLRWNDALIPVIKLDAYKLGIGLTYDINVSKLHSASKYRGGFELTLSYKSFLNNKNSSYNKVRCPIGF